jgi:hypothetical protein
LHVGDPGVGTQDPGEVVERGRLVVDGENR